MPEESGEVSAEGLDEISAENTVEDSSFSFLRCNNTAVKNAAFLLSAPNSAWLKEADWVDGTLPRDMNFLYASLRNHRSC